MNSNVLLEDTAYALKRRGEFDKAVFTYAKEYKRNVEQEGSIYLARLCFEQIFDIILIKYLRDQKRFDDSKSLLHALKSEMQRVFTEIDIRDVEHFEEFFNRSTKKLFPGGRGKSAFSVDRNQLLTPRVAEFEDMHAMVKEDKTDYKT